MTDAAKSDDEIYVFLCYESSEKFCHRHLFAEWINQFLDDDHKVTEFEINTKLLKYEGYWNRSDVSVDDEAMYIFTDNTDRDSGSNIIGNSWYCHKYSHGKILHYPTKTTAVIRGLYNAFPISTQHWYNDNAKGISGRWIDDYAEEFEEVVKDEVDTIIKVWNKRNYKRIWYPDGDGFFGSYISNITEERCPKIYKILVKYLEKLRRNIK